MACMKKGSSKNGYLCHFLFFSDARMGTSLNMGEVAYDLLFAHKSIIDISIFYDIINIVRSFNNGALVQGENASLAAKRSSVRIRYAPYLMIKKAVYRPLFYFCETAFHGIANLIRQPLPIKRESERRQPSRLQTNG